MVGYSAVATCVESCRAASYGNSDPSGIDLSRKEAASAIYRFTQRAAARSNVAGFSPHDPCRTLAGDRLDVGVEPGHRLEEAGPLQSDHNRRMRPT